MLKTIENITAMVDNFILNRLSVALLTRLYCLWPWAEYCHCKKSVSCNYADHILLSVDIFTSGPSYPNCRLRRRKHGRTGPGPVGPQLLISGSSRHYPVHMQRTQGQGQSQDTANSMTATANSSRPTRRAGTSVKQKTGG